MCGDIFHYFYWCCSMKSILMLFAPKFKEFGVDIAKSLLVSCPGLKITGLCTGGTSVVSYVSGELGSSLSGLYDLEAKERDWLAQKDSEIEYSYLAGLDKTYGAGTVGEVITADRRVGLGFARGGVTRPDDIGNQSLSSPVEVPQKYIQGLFFFIEKLFDEYNFDGVFCYAVAGGPAVALAKFCEARDTVFTRLNVTRIEDGFVVDTDYKGLLKPIRERFFSDDFIDKECLDKARFFLAKYRSKPSDPGYMVYNKNILNKNKVIALVGRFLFYTLAFFMKPLSPDRYRSRLSFLGLKRKVFDIKIEWKKVRFDLSIFDSNTPSGKYLYYPLHVDPEASTMVLSPMHTDQISVIEAIAKSLPGDKILVVKEHIPMIGKRSPIFYDAIKNMPRVRLVSPLLSAHDLIKSSEGVVVITGTAAFEASLLGKKSIVIGDSPYLAIGTGLIHEKSLCDLPAAIKSLEDMADPKDEEIVRYIACAFSESFNVKTSLLWGDYLSHSEQDRAEAVKNISNAIMEKVVV